MDTVLDRICTEKRSHIARQKEITPLEDLKRKVKKSSLTRAFIKKITDFEKNGEAALIAEIKKASPSGGLIREDFDPAILARAYEDGRAACLSVLTDEPYFQGRDDYLDKARAVCSLPVLRKDFMLDPYQIYESRVIGADCVLLIMAALSDSQAQDLYNLATDLTMDVLVEVHDSKELERALNLDPAMIGVNNRNLKTLEVDLSTSERLVKDIPGSIIKIAESGIYTSDDMQRLKNTGFQGFLVGESLMKQPDVKTATETLLEKNS